jgi:hypothetical protein
MADQAHTLDPEDLVLTVKTKTRTSVVLTVKTASLALAVGTPLIAIAWL